MTVRSQQCPRCSASVNVLATMQTVRCPGCGNVFSASASNATSSNASPPCGSSASQKNSVVESMMTFVPPARTTTEKAFMVPDGKVRASIEKMLDKTRENSIRQLAALHDLSVDQVRDIVTEGDMKNWDPRARSRMYRDGERFFTDERTQGYQQSGPLK